jgi:hypothetical protein
MPIINGKHVEPADAIKRGRCPETGQRIAEIEDIEEYIRFTWPGKRNKDADARVTMLREYRDKHPYVAPVEDQD